MLSRWILSFSLKCSLIFVDSEDQTLKDLVYFGNTIIVN